MTRNARRKRGTSWLRWVRCRRTLGRRCARGARHAWFSRRVGHDWAVARWSWTSAPTQMPTTGFRATRTP
eukprot:3597801-Lingulodinium_polyedra.AAC.1